MCHVRGGAYHHVHENGDSLSRDLSAWSQAAIGHLHRSRLYDSANIHHAWSKISDYNGYLALHLTWGHAGDVKYKQAIEC